MNESVNEWTQLCQALEWLPKTRKKGPSLQKF